MKIVSFLDLPIAVQGEEEIRDYLSACFLAEHPVHFAPVKTHDLLLSLFPSYRTRYQGMSFLYPATRFSAWCFGRFNPNLKTKNRTTKSIEKQENAANPTDTPTAVKITRAMRKMEKREAKIYGHRLFFDLLEHAFKEQRSVFFLGLTDNQKYNLQRKFRYCFTTLSDICYVSYPHTRYRPEETIALITRSQKNRAGTPEPSASHSHYALVIVDPKVRRVKGLPAQLAEACTNSTVFFDANFLSQYEHNWLWGIGLSRPKRHTFSEGVLAVLQQFGKFSLRLLKFTGKFIFGLIKIVLGLVVLYYPLLFGFSIVLFMLILLRRLGLYELTTPQVPEKLK